jgi:DNA primase
VLVVEGYMDVVSLAAAGIEHVVAPLGTALTEEQAARLARYTKRVFLLFDSDRAGLAATFKAGDVLLAAGASPAVVTLPPGEDPDTIVQKEGVEALRELISDRADLLDRKIQILREADFFSSLDRTRRAVDKLLPTLRATADPALHDMYVMKTSEVTGVRRETLEAEIAKAAAKSIREKDRTARPAPAKEWGKGGARPRAPSLRVTFDGMGAEPQLLKVLVRGAEWVERAAELISPQDFEDPHYRAIFEALLDDPELRAPPLDMDPQAADRFDAIRLDPEELTHGLDVFTKSVNRIRVLAMVRRVRDLQRQIEGATDEEEGRRLMAEKTTLAAELRELDPNYWSSVMRRTTDSYNPSEPNR